jgi:hypothetical protein
VGNSVDAQAAHVPASAAGVNQAQGTHATNIPGGAAPGAATTATQQAEHHPDVGNSGGVPEQKAPVQLTPGHLGVDNTTPGLSEDSRGAVEVMMDPPPRSMPGQRGAAAVEGGQKVGQVPQAGGCAVADDVKGSAGQSTGDGDVQGQSSQEPSPAARSEDGWVLTSP